MATNIGVCHNDPNFAVICSFLDRYCEHLALPSISYAELESWIEETKRVNPNLRDLHIRMLRRTSKKCSNVTAERWEKALVKFCHKYSTVDAWELERLSYRYCKISTKLRLLKNLLECQFDTNMKFKDKINEMLPEDMRVLPVGRDKHGLAYWYMLDKSLNLRIYRESLDDVDSETWELVCRDRDDLAKLIENLEKGDHPKLEKSDLSDASFKSEPVSDFNEDSKDSFIRSRSCTPIKPSPLTIKPEPNEEDENESVDEQKSEKLTMKLKIPKIESDSPSKRLKDKFEKEKGHEIKKKCKLKYEEDEENNEKDNEKLDTLTEKVEDESITSKTEVTDQLKETHEKSEGEIGKKAEGENDKKSENENEKTERKSDEVDGIVDNEKEAVVLNVKDVVNESKGLTSDTDKELVAKEEVKQTDSDSKGTNTVSDADKSDEITSENKDELTSENAEQCQRDTENNSKFENETDKTFSSDSPKSDDTSAINVDKSSNQTETKLTDAGCDNTLSNGNKEPSNELLETISDTTIEAQDNGLDSKGDHDKESESVDAQVESSDKQSESPAIESKISTNEECKTDKKSDVIQEEEKNNENKSENSQDVHKDDAKIENLESSEENSEKADNGAGTPVQKTSDDQEEKQSEALVVDESQKNESLSKITESEVCENIAEQKLDLGCENETNAKGSNLADVKADDIEKPEIKNEVLKTPDNDEISSTEQSKENVSDNIEKSKEELSEDKTDQDQGKKDVSTKEFEQPPKIDASKKAADDFSKQRGNFMGAFEKFLNPNADTKDSKKEQVKDKVSGSEVESKGACDAFGSKESKKEEETTETATSKRQTKVAVRKLTKKTQEKTVEDPETRNDNKDEKSENDSSSDSSDEDSSTSITSDDVPLTKMKGLLAHSRLNRGKALKRQAEESPDESPVEPVSKRSRVRGHVTSKTRSKRQPQVSESSDSSSASDSDDVPLSRMSRKERKAPPRKQTRPEPSKKSSKQKKKHPSDEEFKSKAVKSKGGKPKEIKPPVDLDPSSNLSEEDTGIRRSARVRSLRSRKKKEPSPDFVPSEIEDFIDESETDDEFVVKSKRKKKKLIEFEEEMPKGRNAQRLEAKAKSNNKSKKPIVEEPEDDEAACCKCLKSNQPEWILLCDKCDAGYHTACLRPPLMMIPDGDWFCPPCEHGMLIAKLQENLQTLDTTLLKSDRLVRRKERLAFVGISLDNIIKEEERHEDDVGDNSDVDSESRSSKSSNSEGSDKSSSESSSDSSESSESQSRYPRRERARLERRLEKKARRRERKEEMRQSFIKRSCRSKNPISYKFEEYDELIMDAIQEDMSIPKEPKPKKVKPPGISRGKDMSNILGVSDEEEKKTKKPKKRRPRLTELDETDEGEDDTDDYHVSLESSATEVSAGSEGVVESGSDFSDDMYNRRRRSRRRGSRRTRKSGRKRRGCSRYDDFVVESDYESEDDTGRRSTRRKSARRPVNYREFNSDESEVKADEDDSFHTSDVGSDVGKKKKLRSEKDKKKRKHNESSEDWSEESDSDGKPSSKKKERKPSRKKKYDSGESDSYSEDSESEDRPTRKTAKKGKKNEELEKSESGEEENVKTKPTGKKKKAVIESDSENESKGQDENVEKDEQENEISEVNVEGNEKKAAEENISEAEKKEMIEKLIDEGSETEVSEGDWEEVDINSGSDKGGKMKSPKRKASPARGGTSPKKGASSPKKESPAKKGAAAKKGSGSPKKRSTSPKKGGKKGSASPEKALTSPVQSSAEVAETVPKDENVGEASVTEGSEQVPAKPKAARKPRAPAKPRAAGKNARKRKSTETPSDNVNIDPETKLASTEPVIESSVSEATENTEKETENVSDTSIIPLEPSVSDTSSLNLSHTDDLNKSEEQPDFGSGPELNDSKQETTPEGIPMKRKRTRRTKAQMEIFKKEEEVEIQKMVAQGIPEDVARRRRKSMHKRASLLRSRSQSLEQAPPIGGVPEPIDFLSDENVGIHIKGDVPRSEGDLNVNVASDIRNRHLSDHQMKPNETALTNVNNGEKPVDTTATENIKVEIGSDNAVKKDAEKVGDTKVYDEKRDDSPLSARRDYNNAPVGIVKPEVRQGVIVENRQVMDNMRSPPGPSGRAPGAGMVSPLQGMKDMTMGKVGEQGGIQPPNMPPGYQNRGNTEGFRQPQPNYPGFQPQQGPYVPSQQQPYQQGAPHRPYPYGDQQGPMSPTNYPPNSQYMSPNMPPGPQGYYPGPYRGPMGPGMEGPQSPPTGFSGYGPPGSQNFPPQGPYSQGFHSPTGPYQGQMQGPSPQGPMQGSHPGPSGPMNYPPNMQGGYPHAPQPHYPTPHSMQYPQNAPPISPNQPIRPQAIPASHPSPAQPDNQTVRPPIAGVPPRNRRGFMMDNILKPSSSSSGSQDGEPADEINDIVNYVANDEYFKEH